MIQNMLINPAGLADGTGRAHRCHFLENNMIIVYYYIGMLIGVAVVLLCYFVSRCEYCRKEDEFEHWCYGFCSPARLVRKDDFCSHGKAVLT